MLVVANLGHSIAIHDHAQSSKIYHHEDALRAEYIPTFIGNAVESVVDIDMGCSRCQLQPRWNPIIGPSTCWVDQRAGVSLNERVIPFAVSILNDLLHVGFPIYFGVYNAVYQPRTSAHGNS